MFEKSAMGIFIVETPVHCGTGQEVGIVDQPIQRERHTDYPRIQGSEIKGVFRQYYEKKFGKNSDVNAIFGPGETKEETDKYASAVSFGDASVLFFPVKSLKGTYVWITSCDVLEKFKRILSMAKNNKITVPNITPVNDGQIIIYDNEIKIGDKVILEEYQFTAENGTANEFDNIIDALIPENDSVYRYLNNSLKKKICVVSNDTFAEFTKMSTEVITRIRIKGETGVVETGALWTEEYLPTDTIMYFPVFAMETRSPGNKINADDVLNKIQRINNYIQIGGNETVGKGFVKLNWIPKQNKKEE